MLGLSDHKSRGYGNIRIHTVAPSSDFSYGVPGFDSVLHLLKAPEGVALPA